MPLTDRTCREAKSKERDQKLSDEKGLYLLVHRNGSKYWRHKYRYLGKEKLLSYGVYPEVSLKRAREKCLEARQLLANQIDPGAARRAAMRTQHAEQANTFETVAEEWYAKEVGGWSEAHKKKQRSLLDNNLIPYLGKQVATDITPIILLDCLRKIEARGALETARRVKQISGQIFRYAIITGRAERDPSADLKGAMKTPQTRHYSAITNPKEFGELLRAIDGLDATPVVSTALRLAPLLFVRPGELRHMEWSELDLDKAEWQIPAEKMKMRQPHIVPLSDQAVELIRSLEPLTGRWKYVFPSERSKHRPMSDNALNAALRRLGYSKDQMTTHGFRASARTLLDEELGVEPHLIEQQLAHEVKDPLGRAYNRTKHLPQRKKMMQDWSLYLEKIISL